MSSKFQENRADNKRNYLSKRKHNTFHNALKYRIK